MKHKNGFSIDKNAIVDKSEGVIEFSTPLVITDDSVQKNGTRYDIPSMDLSEYKGQITSDHEMSIEKVIGKVIGIAKRANKVTIDGIKFAVKENPIARLAYNLIKGGYVTDFSIETYGDVPDEEGRYYNAKLIGLSAVVVGNNSNATVNSVVVNSINEAKQDGLDTTELNKIIKENSMDEDKKVETPEEEAPLETEVEEKEEEVQKEDNSLKLLTEKMDKMASLIAKMESNAFDKKAKEPEFKVNAMKKTNELDGMGYRERHAAQVNAYIAGDRNQLNSLNSYHLEQLQKEGVVKNTITLADMGNFVVSPELLSEIEGKRSDYSGLINATEWRETLSLQFAWLKRNGDISMSPVVMCDDGEDGNLKPISEYSATPETSNLEELAAVTPICTAATRFLAADLIGDVTAGYRTEYDRRRAQAVIARLQQAVYNSGQQAPYFDMDDTDRLKSWAAVFTEAQQEVMGGTFIFNQRTWGELLRSMIGSGNAGFADVFIQGSIPTIAGSPYIIVPNDLMPSLGQNDVVNIEIDGGNVEVQLPVFYADLSTFSGRTSGGLKFDISDQAAYEENGTVKSAYQRNEVVLRGSFFRGAAIRDVNKVIGMGTGLFPVS